MDTYVPNEIKVFLKNNIKKDNQYVLYPNGAVA